jgi:hypothetical protein
LYTPGQTAGKGIKSKRSDPTSIQLAAIKSDAEITPSAAHRGIRAQFAVLLQTLFSTRASK